MTKTIQLEITEVEWLRFKICCLERGLNIQDAIKEMILESIKETGPAEMSV